MKVGSLFTGIGGFDLGLWRAGMEIVWQVEIDPRCHSFLSMAWPEVKQHGDVRDVGIRNLEPVDLICGGVPCQPASRAGKQRGSADNRWLWPEALRIISELNPAWAIFENPPGIGDVGLAGILSEMENLGYERRVFDIPACALGSPQIRQRYFIVGHSNHSGRKGWRRLEESAAGWKAPTNVRHDLTRSNQSLLAHAEVNRERSRLCDSRKGKERGLLPPHIGNVGNSSERLRESRSPQPDKRGMVFPGPWSSYVWLPCADAKIRRAPDDSFGLVDGFHRSLLAALGNSVCPQIVEKIGSAILETEKEG